MLRIREAGIEDAAAIARIYNQGIAERQATFQLEHKTAAQMRGVIAQATFVLVAEQDGEVLGWVSLVPMSHRPAQRGIGEYAVYVERSARGRGVGHALMRALVETAERRGQAKIIGRVFTANEASLRLAERVGFEVVGIHRRHGRLDGEWRDVVVLERLLAIYDEGTRTSDAG